MNVAVNPVINNKSQVVTLSRLDSAKSFNSAQSDNDSIISYNTRSAVRRRADLLDRGMKLDEHDFKSESNDGNATPSNL